MRIYESMEKSLSSHMRKIQNSMQKILNIFHVNDRKIQKININKHVIERYQYRSWRVEWKKLMSQGMKEVMDYDDQRVIKRFHYFSLY